MENELIRRAVAALAEADGRDWNIGDVARVRAVIGAIREPTDVMIDSADALISPDEGCFPGSAPLWVAMIDAALARPRYEPATTMGMSESGIG